MSVLPNNPVSSRLTVGDLAPSFTLCGPIPKASGPNAWNGRDLLDKPIVLFFYPQTDLPDAHEVLGFRDRFAEFQALGVNVIGVSLDSLESQAQWVNQYNLPFLLLADIDAQITTAYGVYPPRGGELQQTTLPRTTFVLDTNRRIIKRYDEIDPQTHPAQVLRDLQILTQSKPRLIQMQAPVLISPNFLDPDFCRHLIQLWETGGNVDSFSAQEDKAALTSSVNYQFMRRREHFLQPGETREQIKQLVYRRIRPEIQKAFNFEISRCEGFAIVCYDANSGGYLRPHRDNEVSRDAHRRFAISINLNVGEYEGGYLKFPEYGPDGYRPDSGNAIVFSTSLLHEVTNVTAGRRFTLFGWLYSEQEVKCQQNNCPAGELLVPILGEPEILSQLDSFGIKQTPQLIQLLEQATPETVQAALDYLKAAQRLDRIESATGFLIKAIANRWTPPPQLASTEFEEWFNAAQELGMVVDYQILEGVLYVYTPDGEAHPWEECAEIFADLDAALELANL